MFRRIWQAGLISVATSEPLKRMMQSWSPTSRLATRYVAGSTAGEGAESAKDLFEAHGIRASLFYLGEYVDTPALVQVNREAKIAVARALKPTGLDVHVSVEPTQIGFSIDRDLGRRNAIAIAEEIAAASEGRDDGIHCLMFDMEDPSVTDDTISLHDDLHSAGLPVAQTLQAYLKRTPDDMAAKIRQGAKVRLVKGAFAARQAIAFTRHGDIKDAYRRIGRQMLSREARDRGFYPIFGTHDDGIHEELIDCAEANGWRPNEFEIEMLYGARDDVARELVESGHRARLYLPFGEDWWPYAVRRIAENPGNAMLLGRAIVTRR